MKILIKSTFWLVFSLIMSRAALSWTDHNLIGRSNFDEMFNKCVAVNTELGEIALSYLKEKNIFPGEDVCVCKEFLFKKDRNYVVFIRRTEDIENKNMSFMYGVEIDYDKKIVTKGSFQK